MYEQNYGYGAAPQHPSFSGAGSDYPMKSYDSSPGQRRGFSILGLLMAYFIPICVFVTLLSVNSFSRYDQPGTTGLLNTLAWVLVLVFVIMAFRAWRRRAVSESDPTWYIFLALTTLIAVLWAQSSGSSNYATNMRPYNDVLDLNVYGNVDPQQARGQQYMDAGRLVFTPTSRLDITKSMGFKNFKTYCVAPVVSGSGQMDEYDFWAVGTDCCSGHVADFACGEFSNPRAISGLRLMNDNQRSFFRLAVQQAEAAYNIKANHPIFLYWMQDPQGELNAYQDAGYRAYMSGCFSFCGFHTILTFAAVFFFSRLGH